MKKTVTLLMALCLSLMAAGCVNEQAAPAAEPTTTTTAVTTESEKSSETTTEDTTTTTTTAEAVTSETSVSETTTAESSAEISTASHIVKVETVVLKKSDDGYAQVVPKLIVDGKEATDVNKDLKNYIRSRYDLEIEDDGHGNGVATSLKWGANDKVVSIIVHASETFTDGFTNDVFNYDLDTLKGIEDSKVVNAFGMTDDEFFSKVKDIVKDYCGKNKGYDLDKTLGAVSYDVCKPYVQPDGNPAASVRIFLNEGEQFDSFVLTFNLTTGERI
jgi:hypothetical protein